MISLRPLDFVLDFTYCIFLITLLYCIVMHTRITAQCHVFSMYIHVVVLDLVIKHFCIIIVLVSTSIEFQNLKKKKV